ncbi:MAG: DegV family protein, partial [Oscillospiraceae bacterium]
MKTVIITDSTCDLSQQQAKQLSIEIVPLTLTFDTHSYLDGIDITKAEFFQLQSQNEGMAIT